MAVGIFDSGLGGLTVLDAVAKRLPDVPFVYFGDNAHTPYGVRDADDIYDLTTRGVQCLFDQGCDLVILACNTASAAALRRMQEGWVPEDKRVLGVFVPLIEALTERKWGDNSPPREVGVKHVALFATPATVSSRAFQRELAFRAIGVDVEAQPCAGVVDAIEMGDMILADALVRSHVESLMRRMPRPRPRSSAAPITRWWRTCSARLSGPMSPSIRSPTSWRRRWPTISNAGPRWPGGAANRAS
jgi:glutamate racemase